MIQPHKIAVIAVLGFGQAVAFASSFYLLGVLADPMAQTLNLAVGWVFSALSGAFLVSAATGPALGRWTDRRGGRDVLMASNVVFAAGLAVLASMQGPVGLAAGMGLLGLGMGGGLYGTAFAVLVDLYGDEARRPITAVSLLGALGGGLGWPISLMLASVLDWRGACLAWAALHLVVCLPLTRFVVPGRRLPHPDEALGPRPAVRWDRPLIQLAIFFAGAWAISTAMSAHLPRLLVRLGLEPAEAAATAGLMAAAAVSMRLLDLLVLNRLPALWLARAATVLHPAGALVAGIGGTPLVWAAALGQGAANGLLSVASGILPLSLFGRADYAARHALMLAPARVMQAAGPLAYAVALEHSATTAMLLTSGICLIMLASTTGLGRVSPAPSSL